MKGVPECPKGTYAKESQKTEMKVSFACLSRSRHEALRLARRARTEAIEDLVEGREWERKQVRYRNFGIGVWIDKGTT
ncbi:unnamed protein product [Toxocara canis]|uniref:DUF1064 domain-containing protein n=1 Tax=Toxocara canis TaxID=6265 RepID=A0A183VAY8_TOXCA|nr:unnamed protein product [Toxocara canis]